MTIVENWYLILNPILHGGGPMDTRGPTAPPQQFFDRGSSGNVSNELIFHDFVPFNNQQDLAKPFFRFFFKFLRNFASKTFGPLKFWREIQKNRKKSIFFYNKSYFFWLNMNSTCSQLSFEVYKVSVAQILKFRIFLGQNSLKFSKFQILSYRNVIYLKRKLK